MTTLSSRFIKAPTFPRFHLIMLGVAIAVYLSVSTLLPTSQTDQPSPRTVEQLSSELPPILDLPSVPTEPQKPQANGSSHEIQQGDTLSGIFAKLDFDHATLNSVLAADVELLALDVLRPGHKLYFERAESTGELQLLSLIVHPGYTIHFRRIADDSFEFEEEIKPSQWQEQVVGAQIFGSFYASASQAGVSDADIIEVQRIFDERVNFRRHIQAGDWFEIVFGREMVEEGPTGQTRIEAIRLNLRRRTHSAFLHEDGNYYDENGESLSRAFLRYPMQRQYRVSSPFNPRRVHPVTGRVAPHNGVDFAMPIGTPILTIGDGVVTRVGNHPFAGKYIEIRHTGQFKTRYLHLDQILVRQGQSIERGERVALSGNTGRSTGPHLHFELHVNDRPVDPLTADIPTASNVPTEQMPVFTQRVETLATKMNDMDVLALHDEPAEQETDESQGKPQFHIFKSMLCPANQSCSHNDTLVTHNTSEFKRINTLSIDDWQSL